jgi:hypothetical protein
MALVRKLEAQRLDRDANHTDVSGTYSVVTHQTGERCLQIDTYGSAERKLTGKKSQSIRLAPDALRQLKEILRAQFPEL